MPEFHVNDERLRADLGAAQGELLQCDEQIAKLQERKARLAGYIQGLKVMLGEYNPEPRRLDGLLKKKSGPAPRENSVSQLALAKLRASFTPLHIGKIVADLIAEGKIRDDYPVQNLSNTLSALRTKQHEPIEPIGNGEWRWTGARESSTIP